MPRPKLPKLTGGSLQGSERRSPDDWMWKYRHEFGAACFTALMRQVRQHRSPMAAAFEAELDRLLDGQRSYTEEEFKAILSQIESIPVLPLRRGPRRREPAAFVSARFLEAYETFYCLLKAFRNSPTVELRRGLRAFDALSASEQRQVVGSLRRDLKPERRGGPTTSKERVLFLLRQARQQRLAGVTLDCPVLIRSGNAIRSLSRTDLMETFKEGLRQRAKELGFDRPSPKNEELERIVAASPEDGAFMLLHHYQRYTVDTLKEYVKRERRALRKALPS